MSSQPPYGPYSNDHDGQWQPYDAPRQYQHERPYTDASPPPPPAHLAHPAAHPSSSYDALQSQRQYGMQPQQHPPSPTRGSPPRAIVSQGHSVTRKPMMQQPPAPQQLPAYGSRYQTARTNQEMPYDQGPSHTAPGMDNMGRAAAGGGVAGVAYGVADDHQRDGGAQALRDIDNLYGPGHMGMPDPVSRGATPYEDAHETPYYDSPQRHPMQSYDSTSSVVPLAGAARSPGHATPQSYHSTTSLRPYEGSPMGRPQNGYNNQGRGQYPMPPAAAVGAAYPASQRSQMPPQHQQQRQSWYDNPYDVNSVSRQHAGFNDIDPNAIADDGDDGLEYYNQQAKRRSMLSFGRNGNSNTSIPAAAVGAGAGAGAAAAAMSAPHPNGPDTFGASHGSGDASGSYAAVPGSGAPGTGLPSSLEFKGEKAHNSEWLASQKSSNKRLKWIVGSIIGVLILLAVAGGVVGGILATRKSSNGSSGGGGGGGGGGKTASQDDGSGLLNKDSGEIQSLLNNKDLHRVFPGIDYTPLNSQYPDCLTNPPSQNNVTRDMAVLSQLTNTLRLYGTDCNQTEMALYAIDALGLTDMKLWLGVWLGNNDTTNARQVATAWDVLDKHGAGPFAGVAVGNEVLFRQDLTATELATYLSGFRQNLTAKSLDLPVSTSDLGSNWTPQLASEVDVVMANVHPFFAGVQVDIAASWTWTFWQQNDVAVSDTAAKQRNIISEVGWPSGGGNDCGSSASGPVGCATSSDGSVAGIDEMNQFMGDWVCQALSNGTEYFWFEAFDEPWKIRFNVPDKGQNWEDKWGLMDVNRNLKDGVKIPDCGGKTVQRR